MGAQVLGPDVDIDDQVLIADLREALGGQTEALVRANRNGTRGQPRSSDALTRAPGAATLPCGTRLGDFEILGELGRGGMGVVYRARQISLDRQVALKVLPDYARYGQTAVQRFKAEAQAAARLHHTNVVSIYAQGEYQGHYYYAMELVEGLGLDVVIHSRPDLLSSTRLRTGSSNITLGGAGPPTLPPALEPVDGPPAVCWTRADYAHMASVVAEVADALHCAHQSGVIHRDVKPHNLLLGTNGRLHLTDFGLARLTDAPHLTLSGEILGTPAYLSPEQVRGDTHNIDHRTDVYSLGVTLYEMITRRKPFEGQTREQILASICGAPPLPPRRHDPRIPIDLETICLRAIEKDAARRHPTAALLAEDLRRFAQGRPILSRRASWLEKTAKWVRRHKAQSATVAATGLVLLLTVVLIWSRQAARLRQARQLLAGAYEQLAYFDYRTPGLESVVTRAEALGAPRHEVDLVRALMCMGLPDWTQATDHLRAALRSAPDDLRGWYLLAWAQRENDARAAAATTLGEAERRGPATAADAWFFRGLALHWDDPNAAIESYRQANALRAREHQFYPQALLHLARARNQQLYTTRTIEPFPEAEANLRLLVEHGHYGAYPCYLLSIAHRFAAEFYQGSTGVRDSQANDHYTQALEWARRGQILEPGNDRPITAEAECLESMGRYQEAIDARTRAIAVADSGARRWEGYHYRWRLHYWTGRLETALDDLQAAGSYDPNNRFYARLYPALVQAEMGDLPAALAHARALAAEQPASAMAVLWSATCLRLLGRPEEAAGLLAGKASSVDFTAELVPPQSEQWVAALYDACRGDGSAAPLDPLIAQVASPWKLSGEAYFHLAAVRLAEGDREGAVEYFTRAYRSFDGEQRYTYHAKTILVQMQKDLAWPAWLEVSCDRRPDGSLGPGDGKR